jgi:penicillin G amidase
VVTETIRVKGRTDVTEEVRVTPRGPILTPILDGVSVGLSLRAVWLDPLPIRGFLDSPRAKSFDQFRRPFAHWPGMPLNLVYADRGGTTGYQLVGQTPERADGSGLLPAAGGDWAGYVPFDRMPFVENPPDGFYATANGPPPGDEWFGADYVDTYRLRRIRQALADRTGWDVPAAMALQRDQVSLPWQEMRSVVLALSPADPDGVTGLALLRDWDGVAAAGSAAAAVFELFTAEMCVRVAKSLAPNGWQTALGGDGDDPFARSLFSDRRVGHLCRLLAADANRWTADLTAALTAAVRTLRTRHGPAPAFWQWGDVRPLVLQHLVFDRVRLLRPAFNLGPVPVGGDGNTVFQAGVLPLHPTLPTHNFPNLRTAFDPADWDRSRFVLAGGQSGNPASPHYDDQLPLWQAGEGVPIAWDAATVLRTTVASLRLTPAGGGPS